MKVSRAKVCFQQPPEYRSEHSPKPRAALLPRCQGFFPVIPRLLRRASFQPASSVSAVPFGVEGKQLLILPAMLERRASGNACCCRGCVARRYFGSEARSTLKNKFFVDEGVPGAGSPASGSIYVEIRFQKRYIFFSSCSSVWHPNWEPWSPTDSRDCSKMFVIAGSGSS